MSCLTGLESIYDNLLLPDEESRYGRVMTLEFSTFGIQFTQSPSMVIDCLTEIFWFPQELMTKKRSWVSKTWRTISRQAFFDKKVIPSADQTKAVEGIEKEAYR